MLSPGEEDLNDVNLIVELQNRKRGGGKKHVKAGIKWNSNYWREHRGMKMIGCSVHVPFFFLYRSAWEQSSTVVKALNKDRAKRIAALYCLFLFNQDWDTPIAINPLSSRMCFSQHFASNKTNVNQYNNIFYPFCWRSSKWRRQQLRWR